MWVHIPLVEYCCPKLIWNENTILWCGWEPGAYSTLNLNYVMIQRLTASCFVALQSSSCLSRIQPVNPQSHCSQQVLLPTLLEDQPWIPNLQPKLQTAVPVVNLLASHPQKLTRVNWRLSCARNQHIQHTVLMPTGWKAKEMPDIILSYCSDLNDRILESRKAWYKTWQYRLGCFGLCNKSSLLTALNYILVLITSAPGFTNGMALFYNNVQNGKKKKQNCPLQIGKCSMRKQLMEHQTHMGVVISNLQHSFVWVCYTALSPVQKTLLLTQCELNGCQMWHAFQTTIVFLSLSNSLASHCISTQQEQFYK